MAALVENMATDHLYLQDTELYTCVAKVTSVYETDFSNDVCSVIVTDRTVMHPQGGGQPSDRGHILLEADQNSVFEVEFVRKPSRDAAYIEHIGKFKSESFAVGSSVLITIDKDLRMLHARLHSAGHLLDAAFSRIGWTDLVPSKGYHFTDGPYVEYIGEIPTEQRQLVLSQLSEQANLLISDKALSQVLVTVGRDGERVVEIAGQGCPCGGTHVKNLALIKGIKVTKIKKNKNTIRVSYKVSS